MTVRRPVTPPPTPHPRTAQHRRGSVLLVVIGLLGILLLLGFMSYSFTTYENNSAQSFSEAAKVREPQLSTEVLWDWALEQLILGPDDTLQQSALWGRHSSLLANMFGDKLSPYNGEAINVIWDPVGLAKNPPQYIPVVDQDHDGAADAAANQALLQFNYSPAANGGTAPTVPGTGTGVDYTAPDINSPFLAYIAEVPDGTDPTQMDLAIIPSFHRWQYLRNSGGYIADWATNETAPGIGRKVFRPHPTHRIPGSGGTRRFLNAASGSVGAFPFAITPDLDGTPDGYDFDADGDGLKEAVYIDLDFPVQELPDGRKYIPLFAFTLIDLDSLVNVNPHGNLAGYVDLSTPFGADIANGTNGPVHRSNQGLTPSEINPWWPLRDPITSANTFPAAGDSRFDQYEKFFGAEPQSFIEVANMDLLFMLWGRPQYDSSGNPQDLHVGRYGDRDRLNDNLPPNGNLAVFHPEPGTPQYDDDGDEFEGETVNDRAWRHPLDFRGGGRWLQYAGAGGDVYGRKPNLAGPNPNRFLQYESYQNRRGRIGQGLGLIGLPSQYQLMITSAGLAMYPNNLSNQNTDNSTETILVRDYKNNTDQPFEPSETESFQKSDGDPDFTLINHRPRNLSPFTLNDDANAPLRRKLFTTYSWDRKQYGLPIVYGQRAWEFNANVDNDWIDLDGDKARAGDGSEDMWEFPPVCDSAVGTLKMNEPIRPEIRKLLEIELGNTTDRKFQFRWNINEFWSSEQNDQSTYGNQHGTTTNIAATYKNLSPYRRALTPHPLDPGQTQIAVTSFPYSMATAAAQEFWARRDRQQMARDIYTLLYLLAGAQDTVNYTTASNSTFAVYSTKQCTEMAQFAVNVVDALDPDDVLTKFEFDRNLDNGWNLDDNSATGDYIPQSALDPKNTYDTYDTTSSAESAAIISEERGVVFGVEHQTLALNESLVFKHKPVTDEATGTIRKDHPATRLDDSQPNPLTSDYRFFAYAELHNTTPHNVTLNGSYQLANVETVGTDVYERRVTLYIPTSQYVGPGQVYTLGCRSHLSSDVDGGGTPYSSMFEIDPNWKDKTSTPAPQALIPATGTLGFDMVQQTSKDTDLANGRYRASNESNAAETERDAFLELVSATDANVTFVLRRRLHPSRTPPQVTSAMTGTVENDLQFNDNPFVEIDRITVPIRILTSDPGTREALQDPDSWAVGTEDASQLDIQPALRELLSRERRQPFDGDATRLVNFNLTGSNYIANSLGQTSNSVVGTGAFTLWQPHFDRDFASTMELLSIPLYGPNLVTRKLSTSGVLVPFDMTDATGVTAPNVPFRTAQSRFLMPDTPPGVPFSDFNGNGSYDAASEEVPSNNRWYRLLELISVTDRMHRHKDQNGRSLADFYMKSPVTPGKLNPNTLRHRSVLFAWLDDPNYFQIADASGGGDYYTMDLLEGTGRDWYRQFLFSRDALDPTTNHYVPGTPGSKPFRSLSYLAAGSNITGGMSQAIEHTLLRSLPVDYGEDTNGNNILDGTEDANSNGQLDPLPGARRRLFDIGTYANNFTATDPNFVDYYTRHRLLSKMAGNATTRSHCFAVWIGVEFFECVQSGTEDTNGNGKLDGGEDANGNGILDTFYQVGAKLPATDAKSHRMFGIIDRSKAEEAYDSATGRFNFRPLVVHQRTIE